MLAFLTLIDSPSDRMLLCNLYEKYRNGLLRIAERITKSKSFAEEVLQQASLKMMEQINTWKHYPEKGQKGYFVKTVQSVSCDILKERNIRLKKECDYDEVDNSRLDLDIDEPFEITASHIDMANVQKVYLQLSPRDQDLIRYHSGKMEPYNIAKAMGYKNAASASQALFRARKRAQKKLYEMGRT